jgi:NAD(P)-dependent dehydrogenase (short-subunit alcohol dehydrogenase family)
MSRVILITGGSRGIGAATALLAAKQGCDVCIAYAQDARSAQSVCAAIESLGRRALSVQADVSDEAQILALFATCRDRLGPPDVLVNNAGVLEQQMRLEDMSLPRLERVMAVNVIGSLLCAREAVRCMSTRHGGRGGVIINVSSVAARLGAANAYVDYAASKGAIDTFTIGLAQEVAADGIRVNAVRPGIIDTEIHASGGMPDRAQRLAPSLPMGRAGSADEVAQAILWLASDAASYVTGSILDVGGGR